MLPLAYLLVATLALPGGPRVELLETENEAQCHEIKALIESAPSNGSRYACRVLLVKGS